MVTKIKIKYESGYTAEGIDTNTILQSYYNIKKRDFIDIDNIVKLRKMIELDDKENYIHSESLKQKFIKKVVSFSKRTINHLNKKKLGNINDEDVAVYGALRMVLEYLFEPEDKKIEFDKILENDEKEELLFKKKRTGVLCSVLSESPYIFLHNGDSFKRGRVYISLCIKINNVKYNILLSADNEILKRDNWQQCMRDYARDLENILQDEFDVIS